MTYRTYSEGSDERTGVTAVASTSAAAGAGAQIADLDDGLVLRRGRADDADALAAFGALMHGTTEQPADDVGCWTRDLLSRRHPTTGPQDFTVVTERATGRIVTSWCLIAQRWANAGALRLSFYRSGVRLTFAEGQPDAGAAVAAPRPT